MNILLAGLVSLLSAAPPAFGQVKYPQRPAQGEFILDEAKLLKPEDAAEVRKVCGEVLEAKRAPIVVVTIKSLSEYGASGWPIQRYAMNLFAEWAVGWSDWNYGMLLLVSTGDKKARIELGASWGHLKDPDAQRLMNDEIVPRFKRGDFSGGILAGVKGLRDIATGSITGTPTPQVYGPAPVRTPPPQEPRYVPYQPLHRSTGVPETSNWLGTVVVIVIVLVVVVGIISLITKAGTSSWGPSMGGGGVGNPGCSAFAGGCLGSGLGNWFGGGYSRPWGYWNDPWDRPWGGGGWFGGGGGWGSGSSSGGGWSSGSSDSGGGGSWSSGDSSSSGGGFSGGGGASGEW